MLRESEELKKIQKDSEKVQTILKVLRFASRSDFGELQLTQISLDFKISCYNLKIRGLGTKLYLDFLFYCLERNYNVLKWKILWFLLNKNYLLNCELRIKIKVKL